MGKKKQDPNARQLLKDALADDLKDKLQQMKSELKEEDEKEKSVRKSGSSRKDKKGKKIKALKSSSTKAELTTGRSISKKAPSDQETGLSYCFIRDVQCTLRVLYKSGVL